MAKYTAPAYFACEARLVSEPYLKLICSLANSIASFHNFLVIVYCKIDYFLFLDLPNILYKQKNARSRGPGAIISLRYPNKHLHA
jgi:hypothetical protein